MICMNDLKERKNIMKIDIKSFRTEKKKVPENPATEFCRNIRRGFNLGNTLDCFTESDERPLKNLEFSETKWGNPRISKKQIKAVKNAGFDLLRVPVTWFEHVSGADHEIDRKWMNRVKEVVDEALDEDLYVILNTHHEIRKSFLYPDNEHLEQSEKIIKDLWTQICDEFKNYPEKLIFESMNEPRLEGDQYEWFADFNMGRCRQSAECINVLNQEFTDIVRASGGKNGERFIAVPGYATAPYGVLTDFFKMPEDLVDDHIIISVHTYMPENFAFVVPEGPNDKEFNAFDEKSGGEIKNIADSLYEKFVSKGIPVQINEFGAVNKGNLQARSDYAGYQTAVMADSGISCCWWDNGLTNVSADSLGIVDRISGKFVFTEIRDAIMLNS